MKRNKKVTKPQMVFSLNNIGYKGATPQFSFAFTASDEKEAQSKGNAWVRYHGMLPEDISVTVATEDEAQLIRNEYMSYL